MSRIGQISPSRDEFAAKIATHRVIPVTRTLLADGESPLGVYRKLAGGVGTFLLESAERGHSWSRYSFVGVRASATLSESGGKAVWAGTPPPGAPPRATCSTCSPRPGVRSAHRTTTTCPRWPAVSSATSGTTSRH